MAVKNIEKALLFLLMTPVGSFCAKPLQQRPLVAVVCSYNNSRWANRNLDSIFMQDYENYRVIYVDDCSTDDTAAVVEHYIKTNKLEDRVTFIRNKKRRRKLANLYRALYLCDDNEIVVLVDGDDWLLHKWAFNRINRAYDNPDVWFTYGQYRNEPAKEAQRWGFSEKGYCGPVPARVKRRKRYRRYKFVYMHPRSFYGWLFKLVRLEDLIAESVKDFRGDFYPASNDLAIIYPMVEMAHHRIKFISEILYTRNIYSDIVGFKVDHGLQIASGGEIRRKRRYRTLKKPINRHLDKYYRARRANVFVVAGKDASRLLPIAQGIDKHLSNVGNVYVFYYRNDENRTQIKQLKETYPYIYFIPYYRAGNLTLKKQLVSCLHNREHDYVLLTTDHLVLTDDVDMSQLIYWLEKTYAHAFYMSKDIKQKSVPCHVVLDDDIRAWKFMAGKKDWLKPGNLDMVLFRRKYLRRELTQLLFRTQKELEEEMRSIPLYSKKVGLFFKNQKIVPINA